MTVSLSEQMLATLNQILVPLCVSTAWQRSKESVSAMLRGRGLEMSGPPTCVLKIFAELNEMEPSGIRTYEADRLLAIDDEGNERNTREAFHWCRSVVEDNRGCFLLMRFGKPSNTIEWLLVTWIPVDLTAEELALLARVRLALEDAIFCLMPLYNGNMKGVVFTKRESMTEEAAAHLLYHDLVVSAPMSSDEIKDTKLRYAMRPRAAKDVPPMQLVLNPTSKLIERLQRVAASSEDECIMITVDDQRGEFSGDSVTLCNLQSLHQRFHPREPRSYLLRFRRRNVLILWVPEGSKRAVRMLYAACQRRLREVLLSLDVRVHRAIDMRGADMKAATASGLPDVFTELEEEPPVDLLAYVPVKPRPPGAPRSETLGSRVDESFPSPLSGGVDE